ncbi:aminoglycoside phosphotransferase family protein [Alteribacillus sp. HJP-4]|uniref:aminoglycoside phosphotransferase family protein n=1 Tax=Alteribacillus sp. HJP-4 TaxID=2775394 RepID=UPI0035CCCF14
MDKLKKIMRRHYGIETDNVVEQQGGWAALAYKMSSHTDSYFLKMYEKSRTSTPKWTALIDKYVPIMKWLIENSHLKGRIPVPLSTTYGENKCEDSAGIYLLYEYIDGETIGGKELSDEQVRELAEIIAELHMYGETIPVETNAIKEDFEVPLLTLLQDILGNDSLLAEEIRTMLQAYRKPLQELVDSVETLSFQMKDREWKMSLCHTDIHHWNLMQSHRQLMLIDWEGLKLAPIEADFMCITGQPYYERFLYYYKKIHKKVEIDSEALQFYQKRRKVEDIGEFIEQLLFDEQSEQERSVTTNHLLEELQSIEKK